MKVKVTNIDWCVEDEDVEELVCGLGVYSSEEEYLTEIDMQIGKILAKLPDTVIYNFSDKYNAEELDDIIADRLSDDYGWLVYDFSYRVLK